MKQNLSMRNEKNYSVFYPLPRTYNKHIVYKVFRTKKTALNLAEYALHRSVLLSYLSFVTEILTSQYEPQERWKLMSYL